MTKTRSTKSALISSVIALLLCFTMLLGTTFAWFTDSVTSANNIIKSGNLDIALDYWDGDSWETVEGTNSLFTNNLWEPGHTEVVYLKLSNLGSLALKYQLAISVLSETEGTNMAGDPFKLSDYIQMGVVEGINGETGAYADRVAAVDAVKANSGKIGAGYAKHGNMLADSDELYMAVVVYMPETVGNVANAKTGTPAPTINLGVQVLATQLASESDGFDNHYDVAAPWVGNIPESLENTTLVVTPTLGEQTGTVTVNSPEDFVYLNKLANEWVSIYSNGQGTNVGSYRESEGGKGTDYYYYWTWDVELTVDLDMNNIPMDAVNLAFWNNFDGNGHTISNVVLKDGQDGLFATAGDNGISNLTVKNITVNAPTAETVGALAGFAGGFENVHVENATVNGAKYVGAIAGKCASVIDSTVNDAVVNCSGKTVGGLVGYSIGDPNAATVTGNTVENTTVIGAYNVGGLLGQSQNETVEGNIVKNVSIMSTSKLPADASSNEVLAAELAARSAFANTTIGDNTIENVIIESYEVVFIYNLDDFAAFGTAVNNNSTYGGVNVANNNKVLVEVMADIDMTNAPGIQGGQFAIGDGNNNAFCGVFDGNGHTISNYTISAAWTYNVSLFRTVAGNFTMRDIMFDNCSATKTNNRVSSILVGTIGGGTVTFDNVDIKNSTSTGVSGAAAYVGNMTEGALYFIDCDADNVTLIASAEGGYNAMFLRDGYSHHDYEDSGVWVENCTITNSKSIVNSVEDATVADYNYTK